MSKFDQKKIQEAKKIIYLSEEERDLLDSGVLEHMKNNPLFKKNNMKDTIKKNVANINIFALWSKRLAYVALTLVIMFSVGGGTALASKNSLPGEALYFFKVNITEEIKGALLSSVEDKAEWEAERLELRLNEISALVSKTGNISNKLLKDTEKEIKEQTGKVSEAAKQLEVLGETEAIYSLLNKIQDAIETYNSVLENLLDSNTGVVAEDINNIVEQVEQTEQNIKKVQFDVVDKVTGEKEQNSVDGSSIFEFLSIRGGQNLILDDLYPIRWNSEVSNEESITIHLVDGGGKVLGKVAAMSEAGINYARKVDKVSDLMWNPKYVYDEGLGSSVKVSPGVYRLKMVVNTNDGKTYKIVSGLFNIVSLKGAITQTSVENETQESTEEESTSYVDPFINEENLPDLVIKTTSVSPNVINVGDTVTVSFDVINIGSANFFSKHSFIMSVVLDDGAVVYPDFNSGDDSCAYNEHGIDPGEVCSVKRSFAPTVAGEYKIKLVASGHVEEVDMSNNEEVFTISVFDNLPDLWVKDIQLDSKPQLDEPFKISYNVENIGSVVYFAKHSFGINIELDGEPIFKDDTVENDSCAYNEHGINPGEVCSVNMLFVPKKKGAYLIYGFSKPQDHTPEKTAKNNTDIIEFRID